MTHPNPTPGNDPGFPRTEKYQRKAEPQFPHGYNPATAAFMLHEFLEGIEAINDGSLTRDGNSIAPLVDAAKALALSLGHCLENADLQGAET